MEHKNEVEIKEIDLNAKNNEIVNNNEENNNNNDDNDNNDGNNNVVNIEETIENENKSDFNEEVIAELNADNNGANNNNSNNNNSQEIKPKVKSDILPKLDIHTIGELLKSFLRRLPHPIIPRYPYFPYYIQFSGTFYFNFKFIIIIIINNIIFYLFYYLFISILILLLLLLLLGA